MSTVTEVAAGKLDPSWVGQLVEVVERTRDGEQRTGFRLRGYSVPVGPGRVRLVAEWTTLAVDPDTVVTAYAEPALPGRFTGVLAPGAGAPVPAPAALPGWARPAPVAYGGHPVPGAAPGPAPVPGSGLAPVPVARPAPWAQPGTPPPVADAGPGSRPGPGAGGPPPPWGPPPAG